MLWIRDWWIAALVLLVFCGASVAGVIIYVRSNRVAVRADDLRVGDCIKEAAENVLPDWVKTISCDRPHFGEVFAILTVPDASAYPGDQAFNAFGDKCGPEFFDYAQDAPEGPTFRVAVGYPTAEAWATGDRSLVCVATSKQERSASIGN